MYVDPATGTKYVSEDVARQYGVKIGSPAPTTTPAVSSTPTTTQASTGTYTDPKTGTKYTSIDVARQYGVNVDATPAVPKTTPTPTTPTTTATSDSVRKAEEAKLLDANKQTFEKDQEIRRLSQEKQIADLKAALGNPTVPTGPAPTAPNLAADYTRLRQESGLNGLESQITALKSDISSKTNALTAGLNKIGGQSGVAEVLGRQQEQLSQQQSQELNSLNKTLATLGDIYSNALNNINTIMGFKQTDYANASQEYNQAYNRAITAQQLVMSERDRIDSKDNQLRDDARANLTVMQNMIKDSGQSWDDVDINTKLNIQKLEMQAGMPPGTMQEFSRSLPKANLLATQNGVDEAGNDIVSMIYADENGNPGIVRTIKTGGKTIPKGGTDEKSLVADLAGKYADAGISLSDTLAVAQAKLAKSKIYQDQIRGPQGATTSVSERLLLNQQQVLANARNALENEKSRSVDKAANPDTYRRYKADYISAGGNPSDFFQAVPVETYIDPSNRKGDLDIYKAGGYG